MKHLLFIITFPLLCITRMLVGAESIEERIEIEKDKQKILQILFSNVSTNSDKSALWNLLEENRKKYEPNEEGNLLVSNIIPSVREIIKKIDKGVLEKSSNTGTLISDLDQKTKQLKTYIDKIQSGTTSYKKRIYPEMLLALIDYLFMYIDTLLYLKKEENTEKLSQAVFPK